jgi:hypothetical protein
MDGSQSEANEVRLEVLRLHPSESEIHPEESHMTLLVRPIPPVGMRDILLQSRLHYPEFACSLFHLNPYIAHFHPSQESGDEVR